MQDNLLQQIIDTSLLKCYLQTNEALIAPLLRLKDNNCHVEECERVLRKGKKYSELVLLYQNKGIHKKGLFNAEFAIYLFLAFFIDHYHYHYHYYY